MQWAIVPADWKWKINTEIYDEFWRRIGKNPRIWRKPEIRKFKRKKYKDSEISYLKANNTDIIHNNGSKTNPMIFPFTDPINFDLFYIITISLVFLILI
jgi:hypothetical protein